MVNDYHILAVELATREELDQIAEMSLNINRLMVDFFKTKSYNRSAIFL